MAEATEEGTAQAELDGMSTEELGKVLDGEEESAPEPKPADTGKPAAAAEEGKEPTVAELKALLGTQGKSLESLTREFNRHFGKLRAAQGKQDRGEGAPKPQLTPEQDAEVKRARQFIKEFVEQEYGTLISGAKETAENRQYFSQVQSLAGERLGDLDPIMSKMIKENADKAYRENDEAAEQWLEQVYANPAFLVLHAINALSADTNAQGQEMERQRQEKARRASSTLKSAPKPTPKGEPTQEDLDRMSTEDLGKLLEENQA